MLRPQVQRDVEEDAEDLERGKLDAGGADSALKTHEKERKQSEEAFLWLLLLAAVAECVTTCFVPGYSMAVWGVNVGATALNWLGPFMDGVSYGLEDRFKGVEVSLACIQFRSAFLGVFTSYSFMTDHAGDLSSSSFAAGPLYVCVSILGGCLCFWLGKLVVAPTMRNPIVARMNRMWAGARNKPALATSLVIFVGLTTVRAALGPHGFVRFNVCATYRTCRDPNDPQFLGPLQVADGEELVLGILMSCSAVLLSNYICELFPPESSQLRSATSSSGGPFIDWGCLSCNSLSCVFAGLTYQLSRISPTSLTSNLLAIKFVSSFCGSLSVFSGSVSIISRLWLAGNRYSALWNLSLQLMVGLLFIPYLYKHDAV